jgi:lysophospholipase L1-like esterase
MRSIFIVVFVALFFSACSKSETTLTNANNHTESDSTLVGDIRFLALGDSYTIGHAVNLNQRWPVQLSDSLSEAGINISGAEIIAQTGWTTRQLIRGIELQNPQGTYDLVSLLIGVNNQYRKQDTATYRTEFRELLHMAIAFADDKATHVIVVSIPDYGVTPFAQEMNPEKISAEIDAFNRINYEETMNMSVKYIDITPISRKAAYDPDLTAGDGLHPSGKMYTEWVALIYPIALEIIQNQSKKKE